MKRFIAAMLFCILMTLAFAVPTPAETASAVMETVNVAWDLEENTPVTCQVRFTGSDAEYPVEYIINGMKDVILKDGTRQISFNLTFTNKFVPTKDEIAAIGSAASADGDIGGLMAWTLVDYNTGLDIEEANDVQLTQKADLKTDNRKRFNGSNGAYIKFPVRMVFRITITCPADYDGLCIGVLGQTTPLATEKETAFWNGSVPFSETSYYSADNEQLSHFMRIRAVEKNQ